MVSWLRRDLLKHVGKGSIVLAFLAQIGGAVRAFIPNVLYEPAKRFKVGKPETFAEGFNFIADRRLFIIRDGGEFHAIAAGCTHLGCTVQWKEGVRQFDCPCHGSSFYEDGSVVGGPAPYALPWYALAFSPDGYLEVDTAEEVSRDYRFSPPARKV
jgi:cytochrome b6-f complex iron-sulfur subunit